MKNKDLLNILGEIDEELVEDAAPNFGGKKVIHKKKKKTAFVKYIAVAACCSLILCGAMIAEPLLDRINNPRVAETTANDTNAFEETTTAPDNNDVGNRGDAEQDVPSHGAPLESNAPEMPLETEKNPNYDYPDIETEICYPETETQCEEVEPEIIAIGSITDQRFSNFAFAYLTCAPQNVGEKIADTTVEFSNSLFNGEKYEVKAEINRIIGVDGEIGLCLRYIDDGEYNYIDQFINYGDYCVLTAKSYSFSSFAEMRNNYWSGIITRVASNPRYFKNTDDDYCKYFKLKQKEVQTLTQLLLNLDGEAVDLEEGARLEQIYAECSESVSFNCHGFLEDLTGGNLQIYDNGYLYFDTLGGQLFNIGHEAAREIIDVIIKQGVPQGYIWNEYEGKWYPVVNDYAAKYDTFKEALEENKLMGQLYFNETVGYWEDFDGFHPESFTLDEDLLSAIADVLYEADGEAVSVDNVLSLSDELVRFTHIDLLGKSLTITVYDNGFIVIGNTCYNIGTDITHKIIKAVKTDGTPPSHIVWYEEYSGWGTVCVEDEYRENPAPTFKEAIEQRDLYGKLNFTHIVKYFNYNAETVPPYIIIDNSQLLEIYKLIYSIDGNIAEAEYESYSQNGELIFQRMGDYGMMNYCMWVYGSGYISFGEFIYDVGEDATNRIINLVISSGKHPGYVWNEEAGVWETCEETSEENIGFGSDTYESDDFCGCIIETEFFHEETEPFETEADIDININVIPTREFYILVLHENNTHINNVLAAFRKEQAAFMEEIMKDYQARYSGVVGASFETAKIVSDGILSIPFVLPKEGIQVSSMTMTYYHESGFLSLTYHVGDISYNFQYCPYLEELNNYGTTTKRGENAWDGIEFDVYGWKNEFFLGKFLYPGLEGQFIQVKMSKLNGDITEIPSLDIFEMTYLTPSSDKDIAKVYKEEPIYPDYGETETMIIEGEDMTFAEEDIVYE